MKLYYFKIFLYNLFSEIVFVKEILKRFYFNRFYVKIYKLRFNFNYGIIIEEYLLFENVII